jgi:hypothetical protein
MTFLRNWASSGSTFVLDRMGELFEETASLYQHVYRLDLMGPSRSDCWNFLTQCKGNAELAHQIASINTPDADQQTGVTNSAAVAGSSGNCQEAITPRQSSSARSQQAAPRPAPPNSQEPDVKV